MISVTNIMLMFTDSNSIQTPILHYSEVSCIKPIVWCTSEEIQTSKADGWLLIDLSVKRAAINIIFQWLLT